MNPEIQKVLHGESEGCVVCKDCRNLDLPDNCIDTIITDPPYGLEFMGKDWDHGVPGEHFWEIALRAAKPGAILMAFGGTRTHHRLMCAIEDAGWEIRDCMMWLYGSGFPKSLDISKAIDKAKGAEREVVGVKPGHKEFAGRGNLSSVQSLNETGGGGFSRPWMQDPDKIEAYHMKTAAATDLAKQWDGYGTALKPAYEPIIVAMKPCEGTFAQNAEKWGVGGLWIDGGRIGTDDKLERPLVDTSSWHGNNWSAKPQKIKSGEPIPKTKGRWPANVILDEQAGAMLDEMSGELKSGGGNKKSSDAGMWKGKKPQDWLCKPSSGGASRFFYCAKASRKERGEGNNHPTVKPLALIEYLCKLTKTPTGGIVLDMFGGSGTTALACINTGRRYIVAEKRVDYYNIAQTRLETFLAMRAGQKMLFG